MIEWMLRLFGLLMLAIGALLAAMAYGEYGRAADTPGAYGTQLALQFRIDATDAALLIGGGLLCIGMAVLLGALLAKPEPRRDPYDEHPTLPRELAHDMELPDPHAD